MGEFPKFPQVHHLELIPPTPAHSWSLACGGPQVDCRHPLAFRGWHEVAASGLRACCLRGQGHWTSPALQRLSASPQEERAHVLPGPSTTPGPGWNKSKILSVLTLLNL